MLRPLSGATQPCGLYVTIAYHRLPTRLTTAFTGCSSAYEFSPRREIHSQPIFGTASLLSRIRTLCGIVNDGSP